MRSRYIDLAHIFPQYFFDRGEAGIIVEQITMIGYPIKMQAVGMIDTEPVQAIPGINILYLHVLAPQGQRSSLRTGECKRREAIPRILFTKRTKDIHLERTVRRRTRMQDNAVRPVKILDIEKHFTGGVPTTPPGTGTPSRAS